MNNERIEFAPYQIDDFNWGGISVFVICRDCNFLSGSTLSDPKDEKNHCKNCDSTNLMFLPSKFTEKYKYNKERQVSDAELLQILLQMD